MNITPPQQHSVHCTTQGVQVTPLSSNYHSDGWGHVSPPIGVQATTLNLQPSQAKSSQPNSIPGAVTATTTNYVSAAASDSISAHDGNSGSYVLQATLNLI